MATTDAKRGALKKFADEEGYPSHWSLRTASEDATLCCRLSACLPIAVAGIDIDALLAGAKAVADATSDSDVAKNPAYFYAAARNLLYTARAIPRRFSRRLSRACIIWPNGGSSLRARAKARAISASSRRRWTLTTDLHSMGQWIQEGRRNIIETFVILDGGEPTLGRAKCRRKRSWMSWAICKGGQFSEVNKAAYEATSLAHRDGGVPNSTVHLAQLDAYSLGGLIVLLRACYRHLRVFDGH